MELKVYIANLGKYNEGELVGEWVTFPIDEDDKNDLFRRIGLCYYDDDGEYIETGYEECFVADTDCEFDFDIGETFSMDDLNELAENLEEWDGEEDKLAAAIEVNGSARDVVFTTDPSDWLLLRDVYDKYDLGTYYALEFGLFADCNDTLERYFDYESYGHDIAIETVGAFTDYGWCERLD